MAPELTTYVVTGRYPDDWMDIDEGEARQAVDRAEALFAFVRNRLEM